MKRYQSVFYLAVFILLSWTVQSQEYAGQHIDLPGVKLWVVDTGGSGEPVILLHPRTGNADFFQASLPVLAKAGYRAIAIDFPGWGRSMVDDPANTTPVAITLDNLFDRLRFNSIHLVGTAMGGYIALDYATYKPERLKTLTIAASGLGLQGDTEYDEYRKAAEIPGMADQPAHIREVSPDYRASNPQGLEEWLVIHEHGQQQGVARAPLLRPNTPDKLADIQAPTLLMAGGIDLVTPSGAMRLWGRHITAPKEFIVIPEAGHVLVWEKPEVFNEELLGFLKQY